jgi:hypothetical protein
MVADVQASRRDEAKKFVDTAYGDSDCEVVRMTFARFLARKDIDAVFIATGDRWHATASMMAAEAGKDVYCEKAVRADHRILPANRGNDAQDWPRLSGWHSASHGESLSASGADCPRWQARTLDESWLHRSTHLATTTIGCLRSQLPIETSWTGTCGWGPRHGDHTTKTMSRGIGEGSGTSTRVQDYWTGEPTPWICVRWPTKPDHTMPVEYLPKANSIECRYADGLLLEIDFLQDPFGKRTGWIQSNGTCPVRFIGEKGWVETGDGGEVHLALDGKETDVTSDGKPARGADVVNHLRNFFDCVKTRKPTAANSTVMRRSHIACHAAALCWILQRPLKLDPATESFVGDDEANRSEDSTLSVAIGHEPIAIDDYPISSIRAGANLFPLIAERIMHWKNRVTTNLRLWAL